MQHDHKTGNPDPGLADELFRLVEYDQGFGFISDGIEVLSRPEIIAIARASLTYSEKVCRKLRKFLIKYDSASTERPGRLSREIVKRKFLTDDDPKQAKRYAAKNRKAALRALALVKKVNGPDEDLETSITDLLANIRHLCDLKGLEYRALDEMAHRCYTCEVVRGFDSRLHASPNLE